MSSTGVCPVTGAGAKNSVTGGGAQMNKDWWPDMLNLDVLRQHSSLSDPMDSDFNYLEEFKALDLDALKEDLYKLMTDSQDWWPADYGHYGPFFIRMAWHVAGTYRTSDGRAGASQGLQRFSPTNSWPDNVNLDKARRLLWPVKQKYGRKISWADLFILAGNCAHESMGFKTFGFGGGRKDVWQPAEDIYWGSESEWLANQDRYIDSKKDERNLEKPLAAVHMGLIYVNPEGPNGNPDPWESAKDIRETFSRMGMNTEETVALIAGGHTFGKAHGAAPDSHQGKEPNASDIEEQGFGWTSDYKSGSGIDTISSGLEGAWTPNPTKWDDGYFRLLFDYEWKLGKSPAGAKQWHPVGVKDDDMVTQSDGSGKVETVMFTTDLALREDPIFREISLKFRDNHNLFAEAYAKAWYKLTHRDMGPINRYLGKEVPSETLLWQDPLPARDYDLIDKADIDSLKKTILSSGLSISDMVFVAWSSASTYRDSDRRGGANGARIRLSPQKDWQANDPKRLAAILKVLEDIQSKFNSSQSSKKVSIADLIILAGSVAIEKAAKDAGHDVSVPFQAGRVDATAEHTDESSFALLEPETDGFRNFAKQEYTVSAESLLVDRAQLLNLTVAEMTVLVGGLRVLEVNSGSSKHGVFTDQPAKLTNDFFVNLLSMDNKWEAIGEAKQEFQGKDRKTGKDKWTATRVDLIFGHNSELRAIAEVYACKDSPKKFVEDFIKSWVKVMDHDRFDLDSNYK